MGEETSCRNCTAAAAGQPADGHICLFYSSIARKEKCFLSIFLCGWVHRRRVYIYRREGKGRRCCLGDKIYSIPSRASCFSSGFYEEKDELYQDDMKKSINSNRPCAVVPNSWRGKEFNKLCPPNSSDDLCHFFCMNPSSMITGVDCGLWTVE